jgi:hypothetical protein
MDSFDAGVVAGMEKVAKLPSALKQHASNVGIYSHTSSMAPEIVKRIKDQTRGATLGRIAGQPGFGGRVGRTLVGLERLKSRARKLLM